MDCCCSVTKLCLTLCNSMDCSMPGSPILHYLPEFPKTHSIESVMLSNYLILCHSFLLMPLIFLCIRVFSNESVLCIRWPKYWSFSFSISSSNEDSGLISLRIYWFDLLAVQGTFKSLLQSLCMIDLVISYSFEWSLYFFLTVFFCFLFKIVMTLTFCRVQVSSPVHEELESLTVLGPESMGNWAPGLWKPEQARSPCGLRVSFKTSSPVCSQHKGSNMKMPQTKKLFGVTHKHFHPLMIMERVMDMYDQLRLDLKPIW